MKHSFISFGLVFVAVSSLRADLTVVQKVEGVGHVGEVTLKIKDSKMRTDISPEMSAITDLGTGSITTLMHSQKMYMQIDAQATQQMMERFQKMKEGQTNDSPEDGKLVDTGKKETVNGFDTEIYTSKTGKVEMTYWIAKNFPEAAKFQAAFKQMQKSPMAAMARKMGKQPTDLPGVPVKVEVLEGKDGQKIVTTIVSVKEETLPDSEFTVPAGYQALPVPSFGTGGAGPRLPKHQSGPDSEQ